MEPENKSLYFEDFKEGLVFKSGKLQITEKIIYKYAELSRDKNPIHVDPDFASDTIYRRRIAHGLLVLSLVSGLAVETGIAEKTTIAFRRLNWRFRKPVMIDDWIRAEFKVIERKSIPIDEAGLVVFRVEVLNQEDQIVQSGKWSLIIKIKG